MPALLLALLVAPGHGHAESDPFTERSTSVAWIRGEEVPSRAAALLRSLEVVQPDTAIQAAVERIEEGLARRGPTLDTELQRARAAVARSTPFIEIEDIRRALAISGTALGAWENN